MEPFFEEYPWLLIPIVIVIVEAWNAVKAVVAKRLSAEKEPRQS
ncbi:MAG: hypothetical protein ABIZ07_07955 [Dermatophilaceae bacterium]